MEKAIEIKRRAQRCILNGDLDGALKEYEKLIASGDSDPYHSVLLADLLFKKGDHEGAGRRYLDAVQGYETVGLTKNAIAVCKKMSRLSLNPGAVLQRLGALHAVDGLATEASLYYMQHAELLIGEGKHPDAERSLRQAFAVCPDNVRALEMVADLQEQGGKPEVAAQTLLEAAGEHDRLGQIAEARRCEGRADKLQPGIAGARAAPAPAAREPDPVEEAGVETAWNDDDPPGHGIPILPDETPAAAAFDDEPEPVESSPAGASPSWYDATPPHLDAVPAGSGAPPASVDSIAPVMDATPEVVEEVVSASDEDAEEGAGTLGASTPESPGLAAHEVPAAAAVNAAPEDLGLPEVSVLLNEAQELFKSGERDAARATLVKAAQAYDHMERYDSAASIYRSLSQVNEAPLQVMMLWIKNCQRRNDRREAAMVACELGDRALLDNDTAGAREWFERAHGYDPDNEVAPRRLQRMTEAARPAAPAPVPEPDPAPVAATRPAVPAAAPAPAPAPAQEAVAATRSGPIEVSIYREELVGVNLGALIAEFQKGLEEQLDSDPQGHYDLGMSYREMGLLEHAIESFRISAQAPTFRVRASEMIGRCLLDQGDFDGAAAELSRTLELPELAPSAVHDIRYQLGLALEVGGRPEEAIQQFQRVYSGEPNYPDVASKIQALRKMLEKE